MLSYLLSLYRSCLHEHFPTYKTFCCLYACSIYCWRAWRHLCSNRVRGAWKRREFWQVFEKTRFVQGWDKDAKVVAAAAAAGDKRGPLPLLFIKPCAHEAGSLRPMAMFDSMASSLEQPSQCSVISAPGKGLMVALVWIWAGLWIKGSQILFIHRWLRLVETRQYAPPPKKRTD